MHDARTEWYPLGLILGLTPETLESIRIEPPNDNKSCLRKIIHSRLKTGKPLMLDDLVEALKCEIVGRGDVAIKLQKNCVEIYNMH